jgi:predicted ferric reductase
MSKSRSGLRPFFSPFYGSRPIRWRYSPRDSSSFAVRWSSSAACSPYGCFTFDDDRPRQIWIGGGIGITPFIARMKQLAMDREAYASRPHPQAIDLFHTTTDYSEEAIAKLVADAEAAGVRLHVLHDARDGLLTGDRIRGAVPDWQEASIWFCGPAGFGAALRNDFSQRGFPITEHFHQELFSMR